MPIVTIETWPLEKKMKPELIKNITEVFTEMGIAAQAVTMIIHETQMESWGNGEQHSVKFKELRR